MLNIVLMFQHLQQELLQVAYQIFMEQLLGAIASLKGPLAWWC